MIRAGAVIILAGAVIAGLILLGNIMPPSGMTP